MSGTDVDVVCEVEFTRVEMADAETMTEEILVGVGAIPPVDRTCVVKFDCV